MSLSVFTFDELLVKTPSATPSASADFTFAGPGQGGIPGIVNGGPNVVKIISNGDDPWQLLIGNQLNLAANIGFYVGSGAQSYISFTGPNANGGDVTYSDSAELGHPAGMLRLESASDSHVASTNNFVPTFASGASLGVPSFPWLNLFTTGKVSHKNLPVFANNAAAITGGLSAGDVYRTGADPDPLCVVH